MDNHPSRPRSGSAKRHPHEPSPRGGQRLSDQSTRCLFVGMIGRKNLRDTANELSNASNARTPNNAVPKAGSTTRASGEHVLAHMRRLRATARGRYFSSQSLPMGVGAPQPLGPPPPRHEGADEDSRAQQPSCAAE